MLTPYFQNEQVTLYCGDCLEIMPQFSQKFDAIITDPPYGTTHCSWDTVIPFEQMWKYLHSLVNVDSSVLLFGSEPFSSLLRISNLQEFKYDWIWRKKTGMGFMDCHFRPLKNHEIISVFSQAGCSNGSKPAMQYHPQGLVYNPHWAHNTESKILNSNMKSHCVRSVYENYPTSVIEFQSLSHIHPTEKPIELLEYLVKTYTNDGETVLDFCAGSGTTGLACMKTNRHCVLIEKEEKYCQIIKDRISKPLQQELF